MSDTRSIDSESLFGYEPSGTPIARRTDLDRTAEILQIPPSEREMAGNQEFISIVNIAQSLYGNIGRAISQQIDSRFLRHYSGEVADPNKEAWDTPLGERYQQAKHLALPTLTMLTDGYHEESFFPTTLGFDLDQVLNRHGLTVVDGSAPPEVSTQTSRIRTEVDVTRDLQSRFADIANGLGIPRDKWQDPGIFQYVGILIGTQNLAEFSRQAHIPPETKPRRGIPVLDRYKFASSAMDVLTMTLEDGFQGRKFDPVVAQRNLNTALAPFQKHIARVTPPK